MMDVAARLPRSRLSAVIFLYGSLVAAFVSFVVYGRQALVEHRRVDHAVRAAAGVRCPVECRGQRRPDFDPAAGARVEDG